ncbi:MAG: tetratricopeptide repeat protein [Candidatus Cryptobacteroides sp.]
MNETEIQELLRTRRIPQAYDALLQAGLTPDKTLSLFQDILQDNWNLFLLRDRAESMRQGAESGDPLLQYAWARYNDALRPTPDSLATAIDHYEKSAKGGIPDATMCLAYLWLEGAFGLVDRQKFQKLRQQALDKGSIMAALSLCNDRIFGFNGMEPEPSLIYDKVTAYMEDSAKAGIPVHPRFRSVVGACCRQMGRNLEADSWYEEALTLGDPKACFQLAILRACDPDGNVIDPDEFQSVLDMGRDLNIPDAYMGLPFILTDELYETLPPENRPDITSELDVSLHKAIDLGEGFGAYFLGMYHYEGKYGFAQDYSEAWALFSKGAIMNNGPCYRQLAQMLLQDEAPEEFNEAKMHHFELCALRLGCDDMTDNVVNAYRHGYHTDFASEIEQYYLHGYEEYENDDGRFDAWA